MAAVKKTELYSSLWASCDTLRGGMDASQYKDYILTLLFVKYVTDKFKGQPYASIVVPEGGSFDDMVAILNSPEKKKNIGEEMDKIIARLAEANSETYNLSGIINNAHFNDEQKIGKGKDMVDKLEKLINIFRSDALDFKNNKAEGDDILGDAYEYLMRKFATESGKSKGEFYTPAEVSRILAKVVGVSKETNRKATVYDCACGSGSLLIRAVNEAPVPLSAYGQEKEGVTAGLAVMNTILHNQPTTVIKPGNTFSDPQFFEDGDSDTLKQFDYIVANPPFSLKNWKNGLKENDYGRFDDYAEVPETKGDYAWLLHILKSLKPNGKAAVILPHGVLFRGATEGEIRKQIIQKGYIKGIIGLPPNLFYGTQIAACIIVIDKETAGLRNHIFMIDASHGFMKDGNKNRLREEDIYKIVTTFNNEITDDPTYSRSVPLSEIEGPKNDFNLNISRYIDSSPKEDRQDLAGHILGGISETDISSLNTYWNQFPNLKDKLFERIRPGYFKLRADKARISETILQDQDFKQYIQKADFSFYDWQNEVEPVLRSLDSSVNPKELIVSLSEKLMTNFEPLNLVDKYDVYQVLLGYWNDTMADDVYLIAREGFQSGNEVTKRYKKDKDGKEDRDKLDSWDGLLIPKEIIIGKYFKEEGKEVEQLSNQSQELEEQLSSIVEESDEESSLEDCIDKKDQEKPKVDEKKVLKFILEIQSHLTNEELEAINDAIATESFKGIKPNIMESYLKSNPLLVNSCVDGKITKKALQKRANQIRATLSPAGEDKEDYETLKAYYDRLQQKKQIDATLRTKKKDIDAKVEKKYADLTLEEIIDLVVEDKWMRQISTQIQSLYDSISQKISARLATLLDRYQNTLSEIDFGIEKTSSELGDMMSELRSTSCSESNDQLFSESTNDALTVLAKLLEEDGGKDHGQDK